MSKTKVIAFANNKGGSGKSTTAANVAYSMAASGLRVLLIDGDMQLNLSLSYFSEDTVLEYAKNGKNLYTAIKEGRDLSEYILHTAYENLDLVPSSTLMSSIEFELFTKWQREFILKKSLAPTVARGTYDYILIDSPPTLGCWVMNILCASDYVLVPIEASPWGLFGFSNLFEFLEQVRGISPNLSLLGILLTKVDERKRYFRQTIEELRDLDGIRLFENYIRIDSSIEQSQDRSQPVAAYKKASRSAMEYELLAKEIVTYVSR